MPWFREPPTSPPPTEPLSLDAVRRRIADAVRPEHFFAAGPVRLEWPPPTAAEEVWEIFQGRLLDAAQTRQRRWFESWDVFLVENGARSGAPVISVKLDDAARQVHVVRTLLCHAWEGYHAGGNVYLSRATRKWVRERVGTIDLDRVSGAAELDDELTCLLFQAVVGTSRLPLTSLEAPLPAFSLGRLLYLRRPHPQTVQPPDLLRSLMAAHLNEVEQAKVLETWLHNVPPDAMRGEVEAFAARWRESGRDANALTELIFRLFNEVSLSPFTDLVDQALALADALAGLGFLTADDVADLLSRLLRLLGRHLTVYDLVRFHHQGANYPDALFLDALLKAFLRLLGQRPDLFRAAGGRLRRRALRQAVLIRRRYEGHLVPEAPTSPGENLRVLPPPFVRVPEEQIVQPHRRPRRLFDGDPIARYLTGPVDEVLRQSVHDLEQYPDELRELSTALILDRPLGLAKAPAEPDQTPLVSTVAFSRYLAERRLHELADRCGLLGPAELAALRERLGRLEVTGLPLDAVAGAARPGVVSLADGRLAADDFLLLHTTARSWRTFLALVVGPAVDWLSPTRPGLIIGAVGTGAGRPAVILRLFEPGLRRHLELAFDGADFFSRGGVELPLRKQAVR